MKDLILFWALNGILIFFSWLDIFLTTKNVKLCCIVRPEVDKEDYELNPVIRYLWRKFGLKTTLFIFLVVVPLVYITINYFLIDYNWTIYLFVNGYFFGCLMVINRIHLGNLQLLKQLRNDKIINDITNLK
jgi:hypothetical protein